MPRKIALVGIGKIARDQHIPALAADPEWDLAATVSRSGTADGVAGWTDLGQMLADAPEIGVISLCLPPQPRFAYAEAAIRAGRHVMLEKPPGQSLAEVHALMALADAFGVTLFATWHSRMAHAVAPARAWLAGKRIVRAQVTWREDVRKWHPGQDWVFEPGGMGVFDPGINALSILTAILPAPVHMTAASLTYPANRDTPIAAALTFSGHVTAEFDWRQEGPQTWDIEVETADGTLLLRDGGERLLLNGTLVTEGPNREYPALYARMTDLLNRGQSDVDLAPMVHVADALTLGKRVVTDPFHF